MRAKKRSILLLAPVLMSITVSAATIELNDAQWSSMVVGEFTEPGFSGSITATDYPSDPGYRWDVNVVEGGVGYNLGLFGIGSATNTLGMSITPGGDTWSVDFTNPGTNPANYSVVALAAYVTTDYGYNGWVIRPQDDEERIYEGESKTVEWDFSTGETLTQQILSITSVQKLGLLFIGDVGGASGGAGEDIAIIVGSPATIVLNDAQWSSMVASEFTEPDFSGSITSTTNYPRDPGYGWDVNVVEDGAGYGLFGIGSTTNTLGMTVTPGDLWSVDFTNPGTDARDYSFVAMAAYVTTLEGYTGWLIRPRDTQEEIDDGASITVEWALTTGETLDTSILTITSVQRLGLLFIGDVGGASGGAGEDISIIVGSTEELEEPEPLNYTTWLAEQYPGLTTDNGKTDNPDGDVLDNWNEYAFGGNPTNGNDTGYPVEYSFVEAGGTYLSYIHAQRIDSADLSYVVETTDDLVIGTWTNVNGIISGTNESFAADFGSVTNLIPTDVAQRFIRVEALEK